MSGKGYPIPHFYHSPPFPFLSNLVLPVQFLALVPCFIFSGLLEPLWYQYIWPNVFQEEWKLKTCKTWSMSTTTSVLFILKVFELFYIKKGLCFPKCCPCSSHQGGLNAFPKNIVFGEHWATKQCSGQQNEWLNRIDGRLNICNYISGDETHLDLGGNHHGLFHALCI